MRTSCHRIVALLVALCTVVLAASPAYAQPAVDERREQAKVHFLRGVEHTDRGEWDAALVEFLKSREILPTAKNTYNAAVCLRNVKRFDEALDMYEMLLRDFSDLPPEDRQVAQRELTQLRTSVGTIELKGGAVGATVVIDGRERGKLPLPGPLRVGAGSHTILVSRDGFIPFEARVDVVGTQAATVNVQLLALTAAGRLHVAEQTGKTLEVVVDNAVVGKTPWDGVLAPGNHTVLLRGENKLGTQPVLASVTLNQTATLNLLAEELDASLRVEPKPATASVSIDGVFMGRGAWEGRLRPGAHQVGVTADGYIALNRDIELKRDVPEAMDATLLPDPSVFAASRAAFGIELDAALPIGAVFGGDVATSCTGSCSSSLPLGLRGVLHGIYQASSGFGGGVDVGYLVVWKSLEGREAFIQPFNRPRNLGVADDSLRLSGLTVGASGQYRRGERWPLLARFGAGLLFGSLRDERSGRFTNSLGEPPYDISIQKSGSVTYLYVAPELRIGRRLGEHFEVSFGVEVLVMTALSQPTWREDKILTTGLPPPANGDGQGTFPEDTLIGSIAVFAAPGIGARYDF